ncbi:MAG: hypothetical protein ACFFCL_05830 [Promethearchaeota archaeon]
MIKPKLCFEKQKPMRKSLIRRNIDTLRDDELLALLGIARLLRNQSYTIIIHAFEDYKNLCSTYSVNHHGEGSFRKYIDLFIHLELIQKKKVKRERFIKISLLNIASTELIDLIYEKLENKLNLKNRVFERICA